MNSGGTLSIIAVLPITKPVLPKCSKHRGIEQIGVRIWAQLLVSHEIMSKTLLKSLGLSVFIS